MFAIFRSRFKEEQYEDNYYRSAPENNSDQLHLYDVTTTAESREGTSKGRNFAWSEDEKNKSEIQCEKMIGVQLYLMF